MISKYFTTGLLLIFCSLAIHAKPLDSALSLKIAPGKGYPVYFEIPSGVDVSVVERFYTWAHVEDERGRRGWCQIEDLYQSGGISKLEYWKWREAKQPKSAWMGAQWTKGAHVDALGFVASIDVDWAVVDIELDQADTGRASWNSLMGWFGYPYKISDKIAADTSLGLGIGWENNASTIISDKGKSNQALLGGAKASISYMFSPWLRTGFSGHYINSGAMEDALTTFSWFWQVRI